MTKFETRSSKLLSFAFLRNISIIPVYRNCSKLNRLWRSSSEMLENSCYENSAKLNGKTPLMDHEFSKFTS